MTSILPLFQSPIAASSSNRKRPPRPTGPVKYQNIKPPKERLTHKQFVGSMKENVLNLPNLKIWHNHKTPIKDPKDPQEVLYAASVSQDEDLSKLLKEFYPSFESDQEMFREMVIPPETFCGLDVMESGFVFDGEAGRQRIVEHCLAHETKGKVLRENGLGTLDDLKVFVPLFQPLLEEKGRCSAIVTGNDALYLDYIGLMADIAKADTTPRSRYYFLGFQARRLEVDLLVTAIRRKNKNPKRAKVSKKLDDALTEKEELQVFNLMCDKEANELAKKGGDLKDYKQQVRARFTDTTKNSKRNDLYVNEAKKFLVNNKIYSKSTLTLGTMWLFDDFEEEQSAGIGALLELSLFTELQNLLKIV